VKSYRKRFLSLNICDLKEITMTQSKVIRAALFVFLAVSLLVTPLLAACTQEAPSAPATEKPDVVKVGRLTDLTGPYASISPPILAGFKDYAEMLNKKEGGIDGVPVEVLWADVKQDAALAVSAYKRFKGENALVMSAVSSGLTFAIRKLAEEDRIPIVSQAMNMSLYSPPSDVVWANNVANPGETLTQLIWFDTQVWDRAKMGRAFKIGFLAWDIAYTKGGLPGMYKYCDENGIEMVGTEIVPPPTLDYTTQLKRMVDAGADVIFVSLCASSSGIALKQMNELGLLAPLEEAVATPGKIVPLLNDCAFYIASMQAAPDAAKFAYGETPWGAWHEMDKFDGIRQRNDWMIEKYGHIWHSVQEDEGSYNSGWNCMKVIAHAIERAVGNVGWANLDGEAIIQKGLMGLKVTENLVSGDLSFADYEGDRIGVESVRPAAWDAKRTTRLPIGDFMRVDRKYYVPSYTPKKPHPGMYTD